MRKILAAVALVLALSACGEDAPTVAPPPASQDATYDNDLRVMGEAWLSMSSQEQHLLCGSWANDPDYAYDLLSDLILSRQAIKDHFDSVCF